MKRKKTTVTIDPKVRPAKENMKTTILEIRTKIPGTVIGVGQDMIRQMYVVIQPTNGTPVIVQHMTSLAVVKGQEVKYAELIGFRKVGRMYEDRP